MKLWSMLIALTTTWAYAAEPYRLVLVSDPQSLPRAQEFAQYMRSQNPFNRIPAHEFEIKIVSVDAAQLACGFHDTQAPRLLTCNTDAANRIKRDNNAHAAAIFTAAGRGGSGGQIPVAASDYPLSTMLHELLHMYGLEDEYAYTGTEITKYCDNPPQGDNVAMITPDPPYADKADALQKHGSRIPWASQIAPATPITEGQNLGTPLSYTQEIGLFEGGHCSLAPGQRKFYRPYLNSIMRTLTDNIQPFYQQRIISAMEAARQAPFSSLANSQVNDTTGVDPLCPPLLPASDTAVDAQGLRDEIQHIYHHILYPKNPHPGHNHGQ